MSDGQHLTLDKDATAERDPDLWFDDGNIVFTAQLVAFRVHKSVMARHSEFFTSLFAIPQPSHDEETCLFDGVQNVHVSDTSYDFRTLIRALYGDISYIDPELSPDFPVLAALARMSHKYQISRLLTAAVGRLKQMFPNKLHLWDARSDDMQARAIEAVNLFRLLDRPDMLVTALYDCCQLPPDPIVNGAPRADGTLDRLSPEDLKVCWELRRTLASRDAAVAFRFVAPFRASAGSACPQVDVCARAIEEQHLRGYRNSLTGILSVNPLGSLFSDSARDTLEETGACQWCVKEVIKRAESLREEVWDELPGLMGLNVVEWGGEP